MFSNEDEASVFEAVLGEAVEELHPSLRAYARAIPAGRVGVGSGVYREAGLRSRVLSPVFRVLARQGIAFPEFGRDVPFSIRNECGASGRRSAERAFHFPGSTRVMVDTMSAVDGMIVDRIGLSGELEVTLSASVRSGALVMESRRIALHVGPLRIPLARVAAVRLVERAAEDGAQEVELSVRMPVLGEVYGYRGRFTYALVPRVEP